MKVLYIFERRQHAFLRQDERRRTTGGCPSDSVVSGRILSPQISTARVSQVISLAQRVRDFRYSKGWGPDELASSAEISRTALYQIESGKTGLPRAGTLRRIAVALEVSMDDLLGHPEVQAQQGIHATDGRHPFPASRGRRNRGLDPRGRWTAHLLDEQSSCFHASPLRHVERIPGRRTAVQRRATTEKCSDEL